jgi:hypothetical protein
LKWEFGLRKDGLLDEFPLHLFIRGSDRLSIVVIDSLELGRLHLTQVSSKGGTVIALSHDRRLLEQTKEAMAATGERIQLIQADASSLPFLDQSVEVIITNSTWEAEAGQKAASNGLLNAASKDAARALTSTGQFVTLGRVSDPRATPDQKQEACWAQTRTYYARPASGKRYFVTHDWIPSPWPFGAVHHGRLRSLLIGIDLMLSPVGLSPLYGGVSLAIHSNSPNPSPVQRWIEAAKNNGDCAKAALADQRRVDVFVTTGKNALLLGATDGRVIAKFPFTNIELERMKSHLANINDLNGSGDPRVTCFLPEILDYGVLNGQAYWVESWIEGISGTTFKWRAGWKRTVGESALHFLIYLHRSTSKPTQIHRELFDALLQEQVAGVEETVRGFEPGFDLRPLLEALWNVFGGRQMPRVRTHGDFGLANILVSNEGQLVGVLDWDAIMEQGWPVLDLLNLIACQRKWRAIWLFGNMVTRTLMHRRLAAWEREMMARYCGALSIEDSLWPGFIALYWLGRVSWLRHAFCEKWLRQNVIKPLPMILEELGRVPGYCHD